MKYFFRLLSFVVFSLIMSSCGVVSTVYNIYRSQENIPVPDHALETNGEYETIWNISDIQVIGESDCCHSNPALVGVSHKIIIAGINKDSYFDPAAITAIDSNSGEILWKIPVTTSHSEMIANDYVLFRGTAGTVTIYAHDVENGELLWSRFLPWGHSATDMHYAENKVFVNDTNGRFSILSEQGEILYDFNNPIGKYLDKYFELNGILFMENAPLGIKAVEPSSGKDLWVVDIDTRYAYDPIFDEGEIFITADNGSSEIYSIDQYIGKVNWIVSQDALSNLCVMGDKIYFTNPEGNLVAINRYTGKEISKVEFSPKFDIEKQISYYQIACDKANSVLAISFGDNTQIMGLKVKNP